MLMEHIRGRGGARCWFLCSQFMPGKHSVQGASQQIFGNTKNKNRKRPETSAGTASGVSLSCFPQRRSVVCICFFTCAAFPITSVLLQGSFPAVFLHQSSWLPPDLQHSHALCSGTSWEGDGGRRAAWTVGSQNQAQAAKPAVVSPQNTGSIWNKGMHSIPKYTPRSQSKAAQPDPS